MTKLKSWLISAIPLAVGGLSSLLAGEKSTDGWATPPLSPPDWLFPIVWIILYAMIGLASAIAASHEPKAEGLTAFYFGLLLNFSWTIVFFRFELFWACVAILSAMIALAVMTAIIFRRKSQVAAWLMLPYILWLCFALYLNVGIAVMN